MGAVPARDATGHDSARDAGSVGYRTCACSPGDTCDATRDRGSRHSSAGTATGRRNRPATPPAAQTADPFGEEITLAPKTVLTFTGTAKWDSAFESLIDAFKSLNALLDKQAIKPSGNPMIVYTSTDDNGFVFQAEIPVDQEIKNLPKNMSMGKSPEGKALKFVHRGSYDNMDNTYEAITNHLDDKKLEAKDLFVEEYITDPAQDGGRQAGDQRLRAAEVSIMISPALSLPRLRRPS